MQEPAAPRVADRFALIVSHLEGNHFVTVLPFFTATKEFAIIRE
jgi:hypothetical protein